MFYPWCGHLRIAAGEIPCGGTKFDKPDTAGLVRVELLRGYQRQDLVTRFSGNARELRDGEVTAHDIGGA